MTHRTFISIIVAAALAVTGITTTPARAGNDDVAKWIFGALAVGVIGAAISEQKKKDRERARARAANPYVYDDSHGHGHKNKGHHHKNTYRDDRFNRTALPGHCKRVVQTRRGEVRGFGRRCLLNNYSRFNALPHDCATDVRTYNGKHRVLYNGRCLRQYGYEVAWNR